MKIFISFDSVIFMGQNRFFIIPQKTSLSLFYNFFYLFVLYLYPMVSWISTSIGEWVEEKQHMRVVKKTLVWIGILAVLAILGALAATRYYSIPMPVGVQGEQADALARKMELAVNKEAWNNTRFVKWSSRQGITYVWDKWQGQLLVEKDDLVVVIRTEDQTGKAWNTKKQLQGAAEKKALANAWKNFCNDMFWLNPVVKTFDPGVTRSIVRVNNREHLLVTYGDGGITPGDSYLWELDSKGRPVAWQMWVGILPLKGIRFTWENWKQTQTGAWISTDHRVGKFNLRAVDHLKTGNTLQAIGVTNSIFEKP